MPPIVRLDVESLASNAANALTDTCPDLDTHSATATPSPDIHQDEQTLNEVQEAIQKNG